MTESTVSIDAQLTSRETQLAEDMARVLDLLSRVIQGMDTGNLPYAHEKVAILSRGVDALERTLAYAVGDGATVRPDVLRTVITEYGRHYAAGRALYPAGDLR